MSGSSDRDPQPDRDRDRIKFPFGHSVEGPLEDLLKSDAGPVRFDSDEGPLRADSDVSGSLGGLLDDSGSDLRPLRPGDAGVDALERTHPEDLDAFEDELSASGPALPTLTPRGARRVEYDSEEGRVGWAPDFSPEPEEDSDAEELTASEIGRIIDVEVDRKPPARIFDPIPLEPKPGSSGRAPGRAPAPPLPPSRPSGRVAGPPLPPSRPSSRAPSPPLPPSRPSGRVASPPTPSGRIPLPPRRPPPPLPAPPSSASGRVKPPPPSEAAVRSEVPTRIIVPPSAPTTPSGRNVAATRPSSARAPGDAPTLPIGGGRGPTPPAPAGPRPPSTPSGRQRAAGPLATDAEPPTLSTHAPGHAAPAGPPTPPASELPTRAPAYTRSPFDSESESSAPPIHMLTSAPSRHAADEDLASLERTHPESAPNFPALHDSAEQPDGAPRGLASRDELQWPDDPSEQLDVIDVIDVASGESDLGRPSDATSLTSAGGPLLRGVISDEGAPLDPDSQRVTFLPRSVQGAADEDDSSMEVIGRRTAELDVPYGAPADKARLFQDSDITQLPSLPELFGSSEGPVSGLLDSQEGPAYGELSPPPPGKAGAPGPTARLVHASVEKVVGLWEGDTAWVLASLGGALVGPILVAHGWEYYGLATDERPGHALHELLRPGGSMGVVFGLAGAALFLLNLTYIARRRLGVLKRWISLRVWLNAHFICGLTGGSFILAHSALLASNDVARVSSLAIAVAIASGIFGRYVLSHVPRRRDGEGTDLSEREHVATRLVDLRRQLRTRLENQPALRDAALAALATDAVSQVSQISGTGIDEDDEDRPLEKARPRGLLFIGPLILGDLAAAVRWVSLSIKVRGLLRKSTDPQVRKILNETLALARVQRLEQRMAQFEAVQDLMDTWRGVHFIVAIIVIATMVLHVKIVLTIGRLDWLR